MAELKKDPLPAAGSWWWEPGTEECPHCGQLYHVEIERRCEACDAASCPHCHAGDGRPCPSCPPDEDGGGT